MDITSPQEFIEKPVIDIDVTFMTGLRMGWTVNDTDDAKFQNAMQGIQFYIPETQETVRIERSNIAYSSIRRRIDRIPVLPKKSPDMPAGDLT